MPKYNIQIVAEYEITAEDFDEVQDILEEATNFYVLPDYSKVVEYIDHEVASIGEAR
jgi:hypothetical protein